MKWDTVNMMMKNFSLFCVNTINLMFCILPPFALMILCLIWNVWKTTLDEFGWNLPESTSLLAEGHQIMSKLEVLLCSFFQKYLWIHLHSFNKRFCAENKSNIFKKVFKTSSAGSATLEDTSWTRLYLASCNLPDSQFCLESKTEPEWKKTS